MPGILSDTERTGGQVPRTVLIACGALAREIEAIKRLNGWSFLELACLPADLHNRPDRIPEAVRGRIQDLRPHYERILVLYGDCGTGGALDVVLAEEGVTRIAGPHCYAMFAGEAVIDGLQDAEPGTFYLTDFLARQFDSIVIRSLGLDRHPELTTLYFGNYSRLVYLAQTDDPSLDTAARAAAERLGLRYERRLTGYGTLAAFITEAATAGMDTAA